MSKIVFKKVDRCNECPYFRFYIEQDWDDFNKSEEWYQCGFTDQILINAKEYNKQKSEGVPPEDTFAIPSWCPLEEYDLFHKAIDVVKNS